MERLAERLGLTPSTVSFHLKKLADVHAVRAYKSQYYMLYTLQTACFDIRLLDILREESDEAAVQAQRGRLSPSAITAHGHKKNKGR